MIVDFQDFSNQPEFVLFEVEIRTGRKTSGKAIKIFSTRIHGADI